MLGHRFCTYMYILTCTYMYVHVYMHMQKYEEEMGYLVGDCLVGVAFLSYAGPFLSDYRDELVQETWLNQVHV